MMDGLEIMSHNGNSNTYTRTAKVVYMDKGFSDPVVPSSVSVVCETYVTPFNDNDVLDWEPTNLIIPSEKRYVLYVGTNATPITPSGIEFIDHRFASNQVSVVHGGAHPYSASREGHFMKLGSSLSVVSLGDTTATHTAGACNSAFGSPRWRYRLGIDSQGVVHYVKECWRTSGGGTLFPDENFDMNAEISICYWDP